MKGWECIECSVVFADEEGAFTDESECPQCGAEAMLTPVEITPCDKGEACDDDSHHFGMGKHVVEVPR